MKTTGLIKLNCSRIIKSSVCFIFLLIFLSFTCAQKRLVSGVVSSASDHLPLKGVMVTVQKTGASVQTDQFGRYTIEVPDSGSVLVFSGTGLKVENRQVLKSGKLNITMQYSVQPVLKDKKEIEVVNSGPSSAVRRSYIQSAGALCMDSYTQQVYYNPSVEEYASVNETGFRTARHNPLSTFSIDVDRASYSNLRRFINSGSLPPADAVRIEEMINYFEYDYTSPAGSHPFSVITEYGDCPWRSEHKLLHVALQGKKIPTENLPPSNLVFLLDVSGSMSDENKLPLVKAGFSMLVNNLRPNDRVAIVVYAGAAGCVLPSTPGNEKQKILDALNNLQAGGSTAGGEGIRLAYQIAEKNFADGGNNRIILATDGDFNVGISNVNELEDMITEKRKTGIYLTCLGFGMGNYKDSKMEILADKGNGNYSYIDDIQEARKVFINEFGGTLFTIARDVKLQIEFNPSLVQAYRLVGYENRMLNEEDFKDDTKDAGEMGAGHTVTALYEIVPVGVKSEWVKDIDNLKYQTTNQGAAYKSGEIATIKVRYKKPDEDKSIELAQSVSPNKEYHQNHSANFRFAASVAMFGMLLRNSEYKGSATYSDLITLAEGARSNDSEGYRAEFIRLAKAASQMNPTSMK